MGEQDGPDWVMGTVEMAAMRGLFQRVRWRFREPTRPMARRHLRSSDRVCNGVGVFSHMSSDPSISMSDMHAENVERCGGEIGAPPPGRRSGRAHS